MIEFLVEEWTKAENIVQVPDNIELVVASGEKCWRITKEGKKEIPDLEAQHEEADTRLALHAAHAAKSGKQSVIIICEDKLSFSFALHIAAQLVCPSSKRQGKKLEHNLWILAE